MKSSATELSPGNPGPFRFLDHTADLGMECFGRDLSELLVNGARGMFQAIVEQELPATPAERRVEVAADSPDTLFLSWLRELLFIYDTERFIPKNFQLEAREATEGLPYPGRRSRRGGALPRQARDGEQGRTVSPPSYKASALLSGKTVSDGVILPGPIKAVTYHGLKVEHDASGIWRAEVLFDV